MTLPYTMLLRYLYNTLTNIRILKVVRAVKISNRYGCDASLDLAMFIGEFIFLAAVGM